MEERIFVIGFPKCGTTSLHYSFINKGISSIHWAKNPDNLINLVGISIKTAKKDNVPLLSYVNDYKAFSQMETCLNDELCYWPQLVDVPTLDKQYPKSKFIFNDREISKWIKSISSWVIKYGNLRSRLINTNIPGLPLGAGKEDHELENWYLWHKNNMIDYFKNKDNFIVFDIEKDRSEKLGVFLNIKDFKLLHLNKSKKNVI